MESRSIEAATTAAGSGASRTIRRGSGAQFRRHLERVATQRTLADDLKNAGPSRLGAAQAPVLETPAPQLPQPQPEPVPQPPTPVASPGAQAAPAPTAEQRLSCTAVSFLTDSRLPLLELLPGDLKAGDAQYNAREAALRGRLNTDALESRLKEAAKGLGIEYAKSDLEGVLRNSGYDAVHLGSSERYMSAIEKFVGEAEKNYRQRAGNIPGSNA